MARRITLNETALAIIQIALGVLLCIFQSNVIRWLITGVGVYLLIYGIIACSKRNITPGVISIVIGIAVILLSQLFTQFSALILGILFLVYAVTEIINCIKRGYRRFMQWLTPILLIAAGIALIVGGFTSFNWLFIVIGILIIVNGVLKLL